MDAASQRQPELDPGLARARGDYTLGQDQRGGHCLAIRTIADMKAITRAAELEPAALVAFREEQKFSCYFEQADSG